MGRKKLDNTYELCLERYTANMKARLELTTRKYLQLLLEEKIKWLTRLQREE